VIPATLAVTVVMIRIKQRTLLVPLIAHLQATCTKALSLPGIKEIQTLIFKSSILISKHPWFK
jgi:hypothetical protein